MKIKLADNQWQRMSEILGNFVILTVGSIVIPAIEGHLDQFIAMLGIVATIFFWYTSIVSARRY